MALLSGWGLQLLPFSRLPSPSTGPGTPVSKMAFYGSLSIPESRPFPSTASTAHLWMAPLQAPPLPLVRPKYSLKRFLWGLVAASSHPVFSLSLSLTGTTRI